MLVKFLILWRTPEEQGQWKILSERDVAGFLQVLIEDKKVDPATIIAISGTTDAHWLFPKLHGGEKMFSIKNIDNPVTPATPMKYQSSPNNCEIQEYLGWIAPDGRYFQCGYGGHREMARQIVGSLTPVDDARRYLEDHGWAVIFRNPLAGKRYMVGMGQNQHLNDKQAKTLLGIIPAEQIEAVV